MATQTYAEIQKQIAALEAQAERLKSEEVAGVVARIKEAITAYGLTPKELFGGKLGVVKSKGKAKSAAKGQASAAAKYIDGKGGVWVGRGKRPTWLRDALAAGARLEDFLAGKFKSAVATFSSPPVEVVAPVVLPAAPQAAKKAKKVKPAAVGKKAASSARASYADGAGNSWTGMGPTPKWLKEAIAGGKAREDFLVKS